MTTAPPPADDEGDAKRTPPQVTDDLVTTHHSLRVGRRTLRYTATSGRIVLRQEVTEDGTFGGHQPKAEVFLTAYTLESTAANPPGPKGSAVKGVARKAGSAARQSKGGGDASRPVTFCFNGGPGSSSV